MKRIIVSITLALIILIALALPVFAVSNPASIGFGNTATNGNNIRAKAFYNVFQNGDMLFMAETWVHYASDPTTPTASQAFSYAIINPITSQTILSKPIIAYEDNVIGIYQTSNQVASLGLSTGVGYIQKILPNPAYFGSPIAGTNMAYYPMTAGLGNGDWLDESLGRGTITDNLAAYTVAIAQDLQITAGLVTDGTGAYLTNIQGSLYLTSDGGNIFLNGIPNLNSFIPSVFQTQNQGNYTAPQDTTNAISASGGVGNNAINLPNSVGSTTALAFTNIGLWLGGSGMPQWEAGMIGLFLIMFAICIMLAKVTGHPVVPVVFGSFTLVIGGFLGFIPIAMAFAITILIVVLLVWFLFSRGYV